MSICVITPLPPPSLSLSSYLRLDGFLDAAAAAAATEGGVGGDQDEAEGGGALAPEDVSGRGESLHRVQDLYRIGSSA